MNYADKLHQHPILKEKLTVFVIFDHLKKNILKEVNHNSQFDRICISYYK